MIQHNRTLAYLLTALLLVAACTSDTSETTEPDVACGILDMNKVRAHTGAPEAYASDTQWIRHNYRAQNLKAVVTNHGAWECQIYSLGAIGASVQLFLYPDTLGTGSAFYAPDTVSIGHGVDGTVSRPWEPDGLRDYGYVSFPCASQEYDSDSFSLGATGGSVDGDKPSYQQIAVIYTLAANTVRDTMGCEGEPYPLPDLPDERPVPRALNSDDQPCETFTVDELETALPGAQNGSTTWHVWEAPGDDFPSTACQLWRERDRSIDAPVNTGEHAYLLGPSIGFSRISGAATDHFDLAEAKKRRHNVEAWNRFGGKGFHADIRARHKNKDNEMRLKRTCGNETHVYVGAYAPHTVTRAQYETLFAQWVRAQAQRDDCPVT